MKRKEMLSLITLGTIPFVFNKSFAGLNRSKDSTNSTSRPIPRFGDGRDWFFDKRFGMFVHWGIYSIPAWHEQYQWRASVSRTEYSKFAKQFNPKKFNPGQWLDLMQEAGMEYLTFTTKHHDGFCMWDTKQTDFNIMHTPYKKDILGMLSDECHKRKVPLCLYYSVVDWHQPNYPNQGRHHELLRPEPGDQPDWIRYKEFLKAQVTELCSNYGTIHGFWWDMNVPEEQDSSVNAIIRKLQPNAVINNRGFDQGDFGTPEREEDEDALGNKKFTKPTEACQSVDSLSWGYKKDAEYYSDRYLIRSIDKFLSANANYLLNVGPTSEGNIPEVPTNVLRRIGQFIKPVRESLYSIEPMPGLVKNQNASYTVSGKNLYVHFNNDCSATGFSLKPLETLPVKATLLNNGKPVKCVITKSPSDYGNLKDYLRLENLPVNALTNTVMVVKLEFDREISG